VPGSGARFVVQVADFADNVGLGNQMVLNSVGLPSISNWGFPQELAKGAIAPTRPIGAPYLPAVLITSLGNNGIWTRGAAAQLQDPSWNGAPIPPPGIIVPYNPATIPSLKHATAANTNGTGIAVGSDGTINAVWTSFDGVYYGKGVTNTAFEYQKIFHGHVNLAAAGPVGRPSIALDSKGTPWVAYTVNESTEQVHVASPNAAGKWLTTTVATLLQCGGCPQPGVTPIVMTASGPVIAYADAKNKTVVVATTTQGPSGTSTWTTQQVASGVDASGLSMVAAKDGSVYLTYYTGNNTVELASSKGGAWSIAKVGDATPPAQVGTGNFAETTGVAVDDNGKIYVTWYDGTSDSVQAVSGDGTTFTPIPTTHTSGGAYPSIAVTPDGSQVYIAWYATTNQDLLLGQYGTQPSYNVGYPSPTPPPGSSQPEGACGKNGQVQLAETAKNITFVNTCLVAASNSSFSITFDNQDAGVTHNIAISTDSNYSKLIFTGDPVVGVNQTTYAVTVKTGNLSAGTYYFECTYHPTQMKGQLVVVAGAK
jgi:hypothetical protein